MSDPKWVDDARADADAKYEVYRKAYSDWWRAVVVLEHLTEEENAVA